jgi:uncharacterized protein YggT (Ycf19 family)
VPERPAEYVEPARPARYVEPVQPVEPAPRYVRPVQPVEPVVTNRYGESPGAYRLIRLVYLIAGIIEALILIRIILKLLAANPNAGFTAFMYGITDPLVAFFQGVFPAPAAQGSVLELSAILAIVVYALLAWAIARVIAITGRRRWPTPTV